VPEFGAESDPHRLVALWVGNGRETLGRVAPILRVVRDAATVDADMAVRWDTNEQQASRRVPDVGPTAR
jgi:hypothetical protein